MKDKLLIGILLGMVLGMVMSGRGYATAQDNQAAACQQSKTIWLDVSRFGRKKSAAQNMTEKHEEFNSQGWKFTDLEIYTENGDLEGFYLTYSHDTACS